MTATHTAKKERELFGHELRTGQTVRILQPLIHGEKTIPGGTVIKINQRKVGNYLDITIVTIGDKGGDFRSGDTITNFDGLAYDGTPFYGVPQK